MQIVLAYFSFLVYDIDNEEKMPSKEGRNYELHQRQVYAPHQDRAKAVQVRRGDADH